MRFYSLMSSLILFVLLLCISDSESLKTLKNLAAKRGGSLSIPCVYDEKYKSNRKYWCKGYHWLSCEIVASTNTSGRTSVTDHPTQNMFTVELNSLQDFDSGYYWCAVEIGGIWTPDDRDYLYLTVSADPAVSVTNSRVSGQEGASVSVQCLYSAKYQNKQKKWCRFKDWSCFTAGRTDTSYNSPVLVSDDGKGSVSVEMRGLQKSDAGWHWFSAGDVGVTVHLTVATTGGEEMRSEGSQLDDTTLALTIIAGLFLLLTLVGLVIWKVKHKQILTTKGGSNGYSTKPDVLYADIIFNSWTQRNPNKLPQADHDDRVIYSSVKTSQ